MNDLNKTYTINLRFEEIKLPPFQDILVLGKNSIQGKIGLSKSFELMVPNGFDTIDVNNSNIETVFVNKNILTKIERKIESPINHPTTLDRVDQDGFGFVLYCNTFQLGEEQAALFLAYSFSDFLIKKYGFKLFKDSKPEYPLRGMTLKYNKNGVVLSLYPYEYASKVLNGNQTFLEMEEKLSSQLAAMPKLDDLINKFIKPENE